MEGMCAEASRGVLAGALTLATRGSQVSSERSRASPEFGRSCVAIGREGLPHFPPRHRLKYFRRALGKDTRLLQRLVLAAACPLINFGVDRKRLKRAGSALCAPQFSGVPAASLLEGTLEQ